ncbi:MAG: FAD-dependent monooxygenase, partial [Xanthobacteraceae bacterium]|nr:FAD-dependent monooxygenase [Xanthobacteraceae bacterium]
MDNQHQVIIVGGGPVGVALAVELGLRGINCALIERRRKLQNIPKGQNLMQRTLEHFYFWGIVDELRAARVMPPGYPIGGVTAYKSLMGEYWHAPAGREVVRSYYFQENDRMPQYRMEEILRRKMGTLNTITTYFGWTAESVAQHDAGVRVTIVGENGESKVLTADYAVGCDGGHSLVREEVG